MKSSLTDTERCEKILQKVEVYLRNSRGVVEPGSKKELDLDDPSGRAEYERLHKVLKPEQLYERRVQDTQKK